MPNIEAEVYNNNKKCDWVKKNNSKAQLEFTVPIKLTTTMEVGGKKRKKKKVKNIQKNLQNKSKHKNNRCFSWVTAVRVLSLTGSHSPPYLPRILSNTVVVSGPAVGAAHILIWSYSCVFLPPVSTAIRTSVFSFVRALSVPLYIP